MRDSLVSLGCIWSVEAVSAQQDYKRWAGFVNINREDEIGRLVKNVFVPVAASSEFRERLLERLTQEITRQAMQPPTTIQEDEAGSV